VVGCIEGGNDVKGSRDTAGLYAWIFEFSKLLDIGIYSVSDVLIWRILIE
jgi:hypothetical protein